MGASFSEKPCTGTALTIEVWENATFEKIGDACTFGSAGPEQVSDLAQVRGSDDGSVHSPNSLKLEQKYHSKGPRPPYTHQDPQLKRRTSVSGPE